METNVPPLARTPEEWALALGPSGVRGFHARQLFRWVHARGVVDPERMSDLPKSVRAVLAPLDLPGTFAVADARRSTDRTRKLLVRLRDGASVETVLIPGVTGGGLTEGAAPWPSPCGPAAHRPGRGPEASGAGRASASSDGEAALAGAIIPDVDALGGDDLEDEDGADGDGEGGEERAGAGREASIERARRVTQCISTQVGCAMGCVFCASGVAGLKRQMGADEIVAQVVAARAYLEPGERLTNVVFMGMGEPLHNYEATSRALRLLMHEDGPALSARRITVSTSGLVPEIARLGADFAGHVGLAISLHAADDATRSRLMPINRKYPLPVLIDALRAYPLPRRRRITIEYTLVAGKNDDAAAATALAKLLRGLSVKINLIPMNPIGDSPLGPPEIARVLSFQRVLCDAGYSCFIRRRRGDDVSAACGQLALLGAKRKVRVPRM